MQTRRRIAVTVLVATTFGCQGPGSASLESDDEKASYGIGLSIGRNLSAAGSRLDLQALTVGMEDALAEREQRISEEEIQEVLVAFEEAIRAETEAENEAEALRNAEEGAAYLAENSAAAGVTTTESGLQYEVLRPGDGDRPSATDRATIHYRGTLLDGTEFDSSYGRNEPATFQVGGVIPGFAEGLQLMPVGSQYRFVIPGDQAYGEGGSPPNIGPNATLVFEVELLEIP